MTLNIFRIGSVRVGPGFLCVIMQPTHSTLLTHFQPSPTIDTFRHQNIFQSLVAHSKHVRGLRNFLDKVSIDIWCNMREHFSPSPHISAEANSLSTQNNDEKKTKRCRAKIISITVFGICLSYSLVISRAFISGIRFRSPIS
jgi:hypothetical protein